MSEERMGEMEESQARETPWWAVVLAVLLILAGVWAVMVGMLAVTIKVVRWLVG